MPSKTFQPLLYDLLEYKWPNTTYVDHYTLKRRKQFNNVNKLYNNKSQREKMAMLTKRSRPFTSLNDFNDYDRLLNKTNSSKSKNKTHVSMNK